MRGRNSPATFPFMPALFSKLPKPPRRRYVPAKLDCASLDQLKKLHEELLARELPTVASVQRWLDDWREMQEVLGEYDSLAYIRKSVNTRDKKAQATYLHLIQIIQPGLASYKDKLNQKLL